GGLPGVRAAGPGRGVLAEAPGRFPVPVRQRLARQTAPPSRDDASPGFPPAKPLAAARSASLQPLPGGPGRAAAFPQRPYPFFDAVPAENNPLTFKKPPDGIDPAVLDAMRRGKANPWNAGVGSFYDSALRHDFRTGGAREYLAHLASLCRPPGV